MSKTKSLMNVVVAGVAAFFLLAATPVGAADATAVKIGNFTFGPQDLKVKAGTTVTWTNEDDIPHTELAFLEGLADVRFGSKADICTAIGHVRFAPNSDRESGFPANGHVRFTPKADIRAHHPIF
jgi:plastocyanin